MKKYAMLGAISGFLAVALGAFGAHGLKGIVTEQSLQTWQTAVQYHMFHTLAVLLISLVNVPGLKKRQSLLSLNFFLGGVVLFSGSLYLLVLTGHTWLGVITPLGGLCFLVGWVLLFLSLREAKTPDIS